jgi:hypothetical protein
MPNIVLPLVKPEKDTGAFVCPAKGCGTRFETHPKFVEHFATAHAPDVGVRHRGPQVTPAPPPKAASVSEIICPVCNVRIPGSDYPEHGRRHSADAPAVPLSAGPRTSAGLTAELLKTEVK